MWCAWTILKPSCFPSPGLVENCLLLNQCRVPKKLGTTALERCVLKAHCAYLGYSVVLGLLVSSGDPPGELSLRLMPVLTVAGRRQASVLSFSCSARPRSCHPKRILTPHIPHQLLPSSSPYGQYTFLYHRIGHSFVLFHLLFSSPNRL